MEKSPCGKFEFVYPAETPKRKVRQLDKNVDPVRAAEHHLMVMSCEYADWAADLQSRIRSAAQAFAADPDSGINQTALTRALHEVKGNAPAFGYELAGDIAASLTALIERDPGWRRHTETLRMGVMATIATLSEAGKKGLPVHLEVHNALAELIGRHLEKTSDAELVQAAGNATR
ncbi:MAG: hypothetical protein H6873_10550 [Hyphomicrobiaceae bacterium]|nr:hypothetical protein [Hyphomicrobiaceae bacterium]